MEEVDHSLWYELEVTCRPLRSLTEVHSFMSSPPPWRTLCRPLQPHSRYLIRNSYVADLDALTLENPPNYCHLEAGSPEPTERYDENTLPKTLVCHDMANGYHDDSEIDGTGRYDAYTFYNWAGIDIFCYFSHHLVTIPPLAWINVAHDHGVKVIGTFITEWATGMYLWEQVLNSETETQYLISALVTIAKTLKFEGWLLNVENKILQPQRLLDFVRALHKALHNEIPNAILIWYDSVIVDGTLSWQNKLNDKNRAFFDICDGFFTNYSWRVEDVAESAAAAGARLTDLFIGIDVWGRNVYGGGMFNTQEAVKVAYRHGCSLAIFAPAWTHEAMPESGDDSNPNDIVMGDALDQHQRFLLRDRALWGSLWPFLYTRVPCKLPFKTSFCRGQGLKRWMYGEVLCNAPWYNLRHMQYQPNSAIGHHGYLLSTVTKLKKAHNMSIKNHKGIMKIRQSLLDLNKLSEAAENVTEQEVNSEFLDAAGREPGAAPPAEAEQPAEAEPPAEAETPTPGGSKTKLRKWTFRSKLKNLFRRKKVAFKETASLEDIREAAEKRTVDTEDTKEATTTGSASTGADAGGAVSTRQSMQVVGVCLRLSVSDHTRLRLARLPGERPCLEPHLADGFSGGSCLCVHPADPVSPAPRTVRLLHCDFLVEHSLVACVACKPAPQHPTQHLLLQLRVAGGAAAGEGGAGVCRTLQLHAAPPPPAPPAPPATDTQYYPLAGDALRDLKTYLLTHEPGFYVPTDNLFGWNVYYYSVRLLGASVRSVYVRCAQPAGPALLGHLAFTHRNT